MEILIEYPAYLILPAVNRRPKWSAVSIPGTYFLRKTQYRHTETSNLILNRINH